MAKTQNNEPDLNGNLQLAHKRFERFAALAVEKLDAEQLNLLSGWACMILAAHLDEPEPFDAFKADMEAEKSRKITPMNDGDFISFMRSIGAEDSKPAARKKGGC